MDTSITHIRPRFKMVVQRRAEDVLASVNRLIEVSPDCIRAHISGEHVILDIVGDMQHYWSPHLNFRIEPVEDNPDQTIVAGIIGPRPAVWTLFMFVYFSVGVIGFFITSYGVSKWMLGTFSYTILALPLAVLFMLSAFRAGKYGESLGSDQIEILKRFVLDVVNDSSDKSSS